MYLGAGFFHQISEIDQLVADNLDG
jgi:hypothetical protein